jgi:hypothetical protein
MHEAGEAQAAREAVMGKQLGGVMMTVSTVK